MNPHDYTDEQVLTAVEVAARHEVDDINHRPYVQAKDRLKALLPDGRHLGLDIVSSEPRRFDLAAFKLDHPDLYERYRRPVTSRALRVGSCTEATAELGRRLGIEVPTFDGMVATVSQFQRMLGEWRRSA